MPQFLDPEKTRIERYFPDGCVWPQVGISSYNGHFEVVNALKILLMSAYSK